MSSCLGNQDNQKERADKGDATRCASFGPNEAHQTIGCTLREHPLAPLTPLHSHNVHKMHRIGMDLNKTPKQKLKKKKKHVTPKVATEREPVRTPKPKTRENGSSTGKRKYLRKKVVEGSSTPPVKESTVENLSNSLMATPITPVEDAMKGYSDPSSESPPVHGQCMLKRYGKGLNSQFESAIGEAADSTMGVRKKLCKRYLNFNDDSLLPDMELKENMNLVVHTEDFDLNLPSQKCIAQSRMQSRLIRRSQCLIRSRNIGPNFPKKCKRMRTTRLRKAMFVCFSSFPMNFKKRRSTRSCRANMSKLCSVLSEFIHQKQRKLRKKKMKENLSSSIQERFLDSNDASACNLMLKTPLKQIYGAKEGMSLS